VLQALAPIPSFPTIRVMFRRLGLLALLAPWLLASLLHAHWADQWTGFPALEVFDAKRIGHTIQPFGLAQNPVTGALVVGEPDRILSFDGSTWRSEAEFTRTPAFRALEFTADGRRLWAAGSRELGYFDLRTDGTYHFRSLVGELPPEEREVQEVWACLPHPDGAGADFVANQKVLRWDGTRFRLWHFPTATRLFPVRFEGELWFTHHESGLHRLGPDGPTQVHPTSALPPRAAMALMREDERLLNFSPAGIFKVGPTPRLVSPAETNDSLRQHHLGSVAFLPDGFIALGTLGRGLLIIDASGRIVREISARTGLRSNLVRALLVDRDQWLWILTDRHIVRLPAVQPPTSLGPPHGVAAVTAIHAQENRLWFVGEEGVASLNLERSPDASEPRVQTTLTSGRAFDVQPWRDGALVARFGGVDWFDGTSATPAIALTARTIFGLVRARPDTDEFITRESNAIAILRRDADGTWQARSFPRPRVVPTSALIDDAGSLWVGERKAAPTRYRLEGESLRDTTPPEVTAADDSSSSFVVRARGSTLLIQRGALWRISPAGAIERIAATLPAPVLAVAISTDERRLYLALDLSHQRTAVPADLVRLDLDSDGNFQGLQRFELPSLAQLGGVSALACTADPDGHERLWLGGPEGLLQLRTAELKPPAPARPPQLAAHATPSAAAELPFTGHAIRFHLTSPHLAERPGLRFQTRLVFDDRPTDWSATSTEDRFAFANLTDGAYRFEARTVTPNDAVSDPVTFHFAVRPPWFRTGWAYAAYATVGLAALLGIVRVRERRARRRQAELEQLVRQRTAELEVANAAKDEFLASMSHEIRNPMNGVVGLSAAIDTRPLDPEGRRRFDLLRHCAEHLSALLEDILDFSRLQSGRGAVDPQPFSLAHLLESVVAITAADSAAAGLPVKVALSPEAPPVLRGDARRLRQILLNLVGNALKYAGRGEIDLTVWCRPLPDGRFDTTFAVSDDGPGIPADEQARIFAKFERGSAARRARVAGTGMGLAVCRTLAEQLGGRVWLESEPGRGATFFLGIPLASAPANALRAEPSRSDSPARLHALVVDDEEYNRIVLGALLRSEGFTVSEAARGGEAISLASAEPFALILLDYDLPDLKGPEIARVILATALTGPQRPVLLATTAYASTAIRQECRAAGMEGFVPKPVSPAALRHAIASTSLGRPSADKAVSAPVTSETPETESDPLENLRALARQSERDLASEWRAFADDLAGEFARLHEAILRNDAAAARSAHQLAGRFGFIHARRAAEQALQLEECCRAHGWEKASAQIAALARTWDELRADITLRATGPDESTRS
jgi:signal transduction histidine kinase/CheY-like chemotaxis protein/HPt (histidine-containing phosphotransfer) domain-containing protein